MKANFAKLRKDVDYLKSTDITSSLGMVEILDDLSVDIPFFLRCLRLPPEMILSITLMLMSLRPR